jgi:hypothetical protein
MMLICEAPPPDPKDYFYAGGDAFDLQSGLDKRIAVMTRV